MLIQFWSLLLSCGICLQPATEAFPHPQTRWARSIKKLKLWSMVRLLGKSMQNMSETSLKNAYTTPWVKSTAAWHCRLIRSKMKWSFPEDCPCHILTNPMSVLLALLHSVIQSLSNHKSSQLQLCKGLLALGNMAKPGPYVYSVSLLIELITGFLQVTSCPFTNIWKQTNYQQLIWMTELLITTNTALDVTISRIILEMKTTHRGDGYSWNKCSGTFCFYTNAMGN